MTDRPAFFLRHDEGRHTARGVAAGLHLAAIRIADAHEDVGPGPLGRFHDDQLVAADTLAAVGDRPGALRIQHEGLLPGIDDDEVVAQSVHLDESATVRHLLYSGVPLLNAAPALGSPLLDPISGL